MGRDKNNSMGIPVSMKLLCVIVILCSMAYAAKNSCPLEDISYYGGAATEIAAFTEADDWQECGKICHHLYYPEKCAFWTFYLSNTCILFRNDDGIHVEEGFISGDVDCYA